MGEDMNTSLLSVVIPVYNTEKYLKRCLNSVLNQSYRNLEIIVVDDDSKGNVKQIVQEYIKEDDRIKYIKHECNKGLFQARVTGSKIAKGDYIAFLDSDDHVSVDFYHQLLRKAKDTQSDIVIGRTVWEKPDGSRYVYNLHESVFSFECLEGEDVQEAYFGQGGRCYSWHTIWNKIYDIRLWKQALPFFLKQEEHIIMTEDIAFSSLLFYYAKKVTKVNNDAYFYCENSDASTDVKNISFNKCKKNIEDMQKVFSFVEEFLAEVDANNKIIGYFEEFKRYYVYIWGRLTNLEFKSNEKSILLSELNKISDRIVDIKNEDSFYFSSIITEWKGGLEYLKEEICSNKYEYISFDIFDTLLLRPFFSPEDMFSMLDKKFEELYRANISFSKLRIDGEERAREYVLSRNPSFEDVTIEEIYEHIKEFYKIPGIVVKQMMEEELRLELEFCQAREATKEIYNLAKILNKKIIIISDMYLDSKFIEKLLHKNGYDTYKNLYVSSDMRLTKSTGSLYKYVLDDLKINPKSILHIGDNWNSDINNAKQYGINTFFLPKTIEVFLNKIQDLNTNRCSSIGDIAYNNHLLNEKSSIGFKIMLAMVANKYFDNPYRIFNKNSDLNSDPYFIGYYLLGIHCQGIMKWIHSNIEGYDKIYFLARDGYLLNELWNIQKKYTSNVQDNIYLYASRRLLLPAMLVNEVDFYNLPLEYKNHTPESILDILDFCISIPDTIDIKKFLYTKGILYSKKFISKREYNAFIKIFLNEFYDKEKHRKKIEQISKYYNVLSSDKSITFDMGYSGKIQAALSNLVNRAVPGLFIHNDGKDFFNLSRKNSFDVKCLYNNIPKVQDFVREYIFSDKNPSCIDILINNDNFEFKFEEIENSIENNFIIDNMQLGALDFYRDFIQTFLEFKEYINFNIDEVMYPLEGFLEDMSVEDRRIFSVCEFDDFIYGGNNYINLMGHLHHTQYNSTYELSNYLDNKLSGKSKWKKFIVYSIIDQELLRIKSWYSLQKYPITFKICRKIYRILKHTDY